MMDATTERTYEQIKRSVARAEQYQREGDVAGMEREAETAAALFEPILTNKKDPLGLLLSFREKMRSFGYEEEPRTGLGTPETRWKKKDKGEKVDVGGAKPPGQPHSTDPRGSTKDDHEYGEATKGRSYGGEDGDRNRDHPRKRPRKWTGPWPPPLKPISSSAPGREEEWDAELSGQRSSSREVAYLTFDEEKAAEEVFIGIRRRVGWVAWLNHPESDTVTLCIPTEDAPLVEQVMERLDYC
jgi:hypothetical protein